MTPCQDTPTLAYHTPPEMEDTDSLARDSRSYRLSLWSTQVSI